MAAIQKRSLVDQVYERLRGDIIDLRLPLGSKVNVNELQDTLGVSCTPIREAINRLQQEGLITYENNVGARVLTLEPRDVAEITQLATTLHCAAAELALVHGDRTEMAGRLRRLCGEFTVATPDEQAHAVSRIIEVFYRNCGNRRLDRSMLAIQGQQQILRHLYAAAGTRKDEDAADFAAMAEGVAAGDGQAVCAAIWTNARRVEAVVIAGLGKD